MFNLFRKPHLLNDQSIDEIKKRFNLSENDQISIYKYLVRIPRYEPNRKSSIKFYSDDEMLSREQLKGSTLFNLFNGNVKVGHTKIVLDHYIQADHHNLSYIKGESCSYRGKN